MKLLALLIAVPLPFSSFVDLRKPDDYHLIQQTIGLYGEKTQRKAELWKHDRLDFYKAVIRRPSYQEFYVEEDGTIILHKKYDFWGEWYPESKD